MPCWLAPCDLGDPGWGISGFRMVRSLLRLPSGLTEFVFTLMVIVFSVQRQIARQGVYQAGKTIFHLDGEINRDG
jgi:hypothetical protein